MSSLPSLPPEQAVIAKRDEQQFEIAKLNIEKAAQNNAMWAAHWYKMRICSCIFAISGLLIVLGFCCVAMFSGKDAIALEIIKAGIFSKRRWRGWLRYWQA